MSQFEVYRLKNSDVLVVCLQHDLFSDMKTTIVAPLVRASEAGRPAGKANPAIRVNDENWFLAVQAMATVSVSELSGPVANIKFSRDAMTTAIDVIFFGI